MESNNRSLTSKSSTPREFKPNLLERLVQTTREEDWEYLAKHPEIGDIIRSFLRRAFEQRPTDIRAFATEFSRWLKSELQNKNMDIEGKENES